MDLQELILKNMDKLSDRTLMRIHDKVVQVIQRRSQQAAELALAEPDMNEIVLARSGHKIKAIYAMRERYEGLGLREARELIEKYM